MAATLKTRAGSALKANVRLWQAGQETTVNTTGSTVRFQLRTVANPTRILLDVAEYVGVSPPEGTVLTQTGTGEWYLFIGKSFTARLPPTVAFEFRLVNDDNPEDSVSLATGIFRTEPTEILGVSE